MSNSLAYNLPTCKAGDGECDPGEAMEAGDRECDAVAGEATEAGEGECDGSDATEAGEACGAR